MPSKKTSNETSRMSSIARRINMSFWLRQLGHYFLLDVILLVLVVVGFFLWAERAVPADQIVADRFFAKGDTGELGYVIATAAGEIYRQSVRAAWEFLRIPALVVLVAEGIFLLDGLLRTKHVRQLMRPLHEMAVRMEQLSDQPFSPAKMEHMRQAISDLDPEAPGAKVTTGDKELQSLEVAINHMLERMRESHRQQERFVSDASHELRTPISVIQGYVNMLDRWGKEDPEILSESIEAIKNETDHMKNLIEQLLFLARGDSGRNTLNPENFDLAEMVRDVGDESQMIDQNHVYALEADMPVEAHGDTAMIKQSLRILVQNASKYSRPGDTIRLAAKVVDGRPAYLVQDEGIGMAEAEIGHIFERFYRSDAARGSSESGTGLGLSIAKWIIDAHQGEIEVLSRPEFGTRFTVKL